MEKERKNIEKELRIKLIEDGSHRSAINRCVDKIVLTEAERITLEKDKLKRTFQEKSA